MKLTVLGCGDAFGNGGRYTTSFLLTEQNEHVLIDCGASSLPRLKQEAIKLEDISTIVISHFHGDHYGGLPFFLISSLFEARREAPLSIVGPPGVGSRIYALQEAMYAGTGDMLNDLDIKYYEYNNDWIDVSDKKILGKPVEHSEPSIPHGIRFEWKGKIFAFSGDTSWTDNLIPLSRNSDLFICECNFLHEEAYGHLCYDELVARRGELECDNIWLSHMGNNVLNFEDSVFNKLEDGMKIDF
ncbi:MAG: MBL fold metallo-hydrolase [Cyclobacteriaceae bacterium]